MRLWPRKGEPRKPKPDKPKRAKRPKPEGSKGSFRERLQESWIELKESPGRSFLQALGVMLGVASVLGGFSIADSQRQQTERIFARIGGIDKLNVLPKDVINEGRPSALQTEHAPEIQRSSGSGSPASATTSAPHSWV